MHRSDISESIVRYPCVFLLALRCSTYARSRLEPRWAQRNVYGVIMLRRKDGYFMILSTYNPKSVSVSNIFWQPEVF